MKIKHLFVSIGIVTVTLTCCNRNSQNLKTVLEAECFWDFWDKKESNVPNRGYRFKKNGECQKFGYKFSFQKRTDTVLLYYEDDNLRPKTWSVMGDTFLIAQGFKSHILSFNRDTIIGKYMNSLDTFFLIRNCNTVSRSTYW